jgi:O-antigen/teichoic acid export membrane protein
VSNPIKKLAGQTVIYGLGTILPRFLNYFLTPILTRAFLPAQYGIHGELYSQISFLNVLFAYGMETTFFNFNSRLDNKDEVFSTSFYTMLVSTSLFSALLLMASPWISEKLSTSNAHYSITFISWCIGIVATDALMSIPFARLRSQNKALLFSMFKLLNVVINFGLTVFFISICKKAYDNCEDNFYAQLYNPEIGIGYCFLSNFIANSISLALISLSLIKIRPHINKQLLREMLRYTWPLVILGLAGMVNETLDRLILKTLMPNKAEAQIAQGIYGACYKIAILMTIFIQAFRFAAEPYFFNKAKDKDSKKTYALVMKYFVILPPLIFRHSPEPRLDQIPH